MNKLSSLSFFFPAYNEEANVEAMIREAQRVLPDVAEKWEIIPVNDGSRDRTKKIIERLSKEDSRIHAVHHSKNRGYGGAVISGCQAAKYEFVFFTDGDLQFDLKEISLLIKKMKETDLVIGYRKNRKDPWYRKVNSHLWASLVKFLFGFRAKDVDCAFKLFRRNIFERINLTAGGAMVSTELLAKAHKAKYRFVEVGVTHYPRMAGTPTGANIKVILRAFKELFKLYPTLKYQSFRQRKIVVGENILVRPESTPRKSRKEPALVR